MNDQRLTNNGRNGSPKAVNVMEGGMGKPPVSVALAKPQISPPPPPKKS